MADSPAGHSPGLHLGHLNQDQVLHVRRWPAPDHEVRVHAYRLAVGGSAANTAIVVARGHAPVVFVARVGADPIAAWLRAQLASLPGLDLRGLQTDPRHPTGVVTVLVGPQGERGLLTARGANDHLQPPAAWPHPVAYLALTSYLADTPTTAQTARAVMARVLAQRPRPVVFLDLNASTPPEAYPEVRAWLTRLRAARPLVLTANAAAARRLLAASATASPTTLLRGLQAHAPVVVLKMGAQGAWLGRQGHAPYRLPPLPVTVRDTTGAGDAFTAGLILGWRAGWDWPTAGHLAALLGALATTVSGAGLALPGPTQVAAYLQAHPTALPRPVQRTLHAWAAARIPPPAAPSPV